MPPPRTESDKPVEHYLLSKVLPRNNVDGHYPFHTSVWLHHNEGFRRELLRLDRAFSSFDPVIHPWKAVAVYRWLAEYALPVFRHWENQKRLYLVPHYAALGYQAPSSIHYTNDFLVENFERIISIAQSICTLAFAENPSRKRIEGTSRKLKTEVQFVNRVLQMQWDEEERFWPGPFEEAGLDEWNKCLAKMMLNTWRQKYHVGELYLANMLHIVGHNITRTPDDFLDIPFCGPRVKMDIIRTVPVVVRALPLVQWMKRYMVYKTMINTVNGVEDLLELEQKYRRMLRRQQRAKSLWAAFLSLGNFRGSANTRVKVLADDAFDDEPQVSFSVRGVDIPVPDPENIHRAMMVSSATAPTAADAIAATSTADGMVPYVPRTDSDEADAPPNTATNKRSNSMSSNNNYNTNESAVDKKTSKKAGYWLCGIGYFASRDAWTATDSATFVIPSRNQNNNSAQAGTAAKYQPSSFTPRKQSSSGRILPVISHADTSITAPDSFSRS